MYHGSQCQEQGHYAIKALLPHTPYNLIIHIFATEFITSIVNLVPFAVEFVTLQLNSARFQKNLSVLQLNLLLGH